MGSNNFDSNGNHFGENEFSEHNYQPENPYTKVTPEELKALEQERSMFSESEADMATRIFKEHAIAAASSICKIALHGQSEKLRLTAAEYVVERTIGRLQDNPPVRSDNPFDKLLQDVLIETTEIEAPTVTATADTNAGKGSSGTDTQQEA